MLVIGLTGGIGSGKSTVTQLFAEHGVPIIDADILARKLTEPQTAALQKIRDYFGAEILQQDGSLDRKKLRHLIFNDAQKRQWLEQLLHPLITQEIEQQLPKLKAPYCIVSIPLLIETGPYSFIDRIIVVDTPEETQIERLLTRDQAKAEDLDKIIKTQLNRKARLAAAHDLIDNHGSLTELKARVDELHHYYLNFR